MTRSYSLVELAAIVEGTLQGVDDGRRISGVNDLSEAGAHEATWAGNPKYLAQLDQSRAGVVLVAQRVDTPPVPCIVCPRLEQSIASLLAAFAPPAPLPPMGIHPTAVIHASAVIGPGARIGPHVVIEANVRIGHNAALFAGVYIGQSVTIDDDCTLWPNVVIREHCVLGSRVTIHANSVIGKDGFGFYFDGRAHRRVPHIGAVRIEDDVEIGACSCVDRSKFGFTVIGRGTKIDNLVQVAHNVRIGEYCILAGQTAFAGSVRTGRYCVFGGRAGSTDNITIGDGARIALASVATKDIPAGVTVSGNPAQEHAKELRMQAALRRLPGMMDRLKALVVRVEQLEASAHHKP